MQFVDLNAQQQRIREDIDLRIKQVLDHGRYIMGPEIDELENQLSEYTGAKHTIACSSGTDALLIAMMAAGVGAGDEVITTPFTFIATGEMIGLLNAHPVFVDIEEDTYNIDASKIEAVITEKTKAIVPVSLYGQPADMHKINEIGRNYNIPVIEDAAQSFGGEYKGRKSCNLSSMAATSFFPAKPLGCYGDGGAVFTDNDDLAAAMKEVRNHGQSERYHHPRIGINGRIDTMQAAILLSKLSIFQSEVELRNEVAGRYDDLLKDTELKTPFVKEHNVSVYAQYTVRTSERDKYLNTLKDNNIPTAIHYPVPLNLQPVFSYLNQGEGSFPVAEKASQEVFSLPMHPYLAREDQWKIAEVIKAV